MVSKTLTVFFVLVVFLFGCTTQQELGPEPSPQQDNTQQELASFDGELGEFQDDLQELANLLDDAEEIDDLQVLEVDESLFAE